MEDPIQFVTQVYDTYYDCSNVRSDAGDFLVYLSKVRANDILNPFLNFLMASFDTCTPAPRLTPSYNATAPDKRDYMAKEWMLYALELLSGNLLSKDNIRGNVEKVLVDYVYPEFSSPLGFLRARACRLYSSFRKLDLDPTHLENVVASLIRCLDDPEFPVCVSAAISLQSYLNDESRMNLVRPHIRHVVERFITLLQKVAVEEIMQSFDTVINKFQNELLPLSSEILAVLMAAFQEYKKDNDNDTAMFTAMTTIECHLLAGDQRRGRAAVLRRRGGAGDALRDGGARQPGGGLLRRRHDDRALHRQLLREQRLHQGQCGSRARLRRSDLAALPAPAAAGAEQRHGLHLLLLLRRRLLPRH